MTQNGWLLPCAQTFTAFLGGKELPAFLEEKLTL